MKNKKPEYSREHLAYLKKIRNNKIIVHVSRAVILLVILGVWELCAQLQVIDPYITSSPSRMCVTLYSLAADGSLFYNVGITLMETVVGFVIAVVLGYGMEPYIVILNALPKIALGPMIIIWVGTGYTAIIFMTVIVAIIVCIMNTLAGFMAADKTKLLLMKSMGANKATTLIKLIIPSSLPALMNTLKVAVGLAWIGSVMGEYISSRAGIGNLINYGRQVLNLDLVMTMIFVLCIIAGGMYGIIALVEKYVTEKN